MKKRILLIGNDDGLPGVKVDLKNYKEYFKSSKGGEWFDSEIIEKINPSKDDLIAKIDNLKSLKLDFVIVVFSGHGGMQRETVFELNPQGELFAESRLHNIAPKQITITDCCRARSEDVSESLKLRNLVKSFSAFEGTRERYERRISSAISQDIRLYSCAENEVSHDTPKGGAYSKHLIETAMDNDSDEFILIGRTHTTAAEKTTREFADQHPEIIIPRLLTTQQLIFGIN